MFWAYYMYMWWRPQHERFGLNKRQPHIRWRWVGGRGWSAWHVPFPTPTRELEDAPNRHEPAISRLNCGRVSLTLVKEGGSGKSRAVFQVRETPRPPYSCRPRGSTRFHWEWVNLPGKPGQKGARGSCAAGSWWSGRALSGKGPRSRASYTDPNRCFRAGGQEKVKRHAREVELNGLV